MRRNCKISRDNFFYIRGEFIVKSQASTFLKNVRRAYLMYFGFLIKTISQGRAVHLSQLVRSP